MNWSVFCLARGGLCQGIIARVCKSSGTAGCLLAVLTLRHNLMRCIVEPQDGDEDKVMDTASLMSAYDDCYQWC